MLVRKTVTILFTDVVTSTELGERLDPESLRQVMSRWFEEMRAVIERHGGTLEKFIGDEVMAVFGVPVVHEDDALRAVRAAAEMRDRLAALNDELEAGWGVRLDVRTGINTGEVVAGDPATGQTFVTGDPVVLAKRLEQAAAPGEILIGKATYPLVRDAVQAGPLESFPVKGKAQSVAPFRLDEVDAAAPGLARRLDRPLVGRTDELARLRAEFDQVEHERVCRLVTVLGPAGIGKSRLAAELAATVGDRATTLTGRCLPYGEGITFWPLAQIVREAGEDAGLAAALRAGDDADVIADRIRGAIGASPAPGASVETFWAVRRFLETLARERPLVLVLEDIHWAERTFLDLIEYTAGFSRSAPILLLCLARHDLLEKHPTWANPRTNGVLLSLEALSPVQAAALLDGLREEVVLTGAARGRIAAAAEGNPLFLEQMVAMAAENAGEDGDLPVPPSIQALLAERLDRLSAGERAVIERAAVIGRDFPRGAVVELCPPELRPWVGQHLMALVRKELLRPDPVERGRDDGFRFRHVLIRDAAYDGLPKEIRAELHERFAAWIESNAGEWSAELDELGGYHLEEAFRCHADLGRPGAAAASLAGRAGAKLGAAGRRALVRGDMPAALNLLERAAALPADAGPRAEVLLDLGAALRELGAFEQAERTLDEAIRSGAAGGAPGLEARAAIERAYLRLSVEPETAYDDLLLLAERTIPVFEASGDDLGLSKALSRVAEVHWALGRYGAMEEVLERARVHAERAGDTRELGWILAGLCKAALIGPRPVEDAAARCLEIRARAGGSPMLEATVDMLLAVLEAMRGSIDESRRLYGRGKQTLEQLGLTIQLASLQMYSGLAELVAGEPTVAERELRRGYLELERVGERAWLSTIAALLGRAVIEQGRLDEAEALTVTSEQTASADDVVSQVFWRATRAQVRALRGDEDGAVFLAREAVALASETDFVNMRADALADLAEVLCTLGRPEDALPVLDEALSRYEAKGNVASAAKVAARTSELGAARPA
jgi:class 3 adenylate cyclase/tetratricopeptide (TPR) repeat protein